MLHLKLKLLLLCGGHEGHASAAGHAAAAAAVVVVAAADVANVDVGAETIVAAGRVQHAG